MTTSTQIALERWADFCVTFSNGNQGRTAGIDVFAISAGDNQLVDAASLLRIDFDPPGKGADLVNTIGAEAVDFTHRIEAPVELWESQADNGETEALEIINQHGVKTVLSFAHH